MQTAETRSFVARFRRAWLTAIKMPLPERHQYEADALRELVIQLSCRRADEAVGTLRELIECAKFAFGEGNHASRNHMAGRRRI